MILLGIAVVNPIHLGGFDQHIGIDFHRAQGSGSIGGKIGVAGAAAKDDHPPFFEMADGAPANIGFGNGLHVDGSLDAGDHPHAFQGIHQGQGIHHGGQHAHVIGGGPVHAQFQADPPAPQVAGANHNGHIHAHFAHFAHAFGDLLGCFGSIPAPGPPESASPLSLSSMRWYFRFSVHISLPVWVCTKCQKKGQPCGWPFELLSCFGASPNAQRAKRRMTIFSLVETIDVIVKLLNGHGVITDVNLAQQHDFVFEFLQGTFDDARDDGFGLAFFTGLGFGDLAFVLDHFGGDIFFADVVGG